MKRPAPGSDVTSTRMYYQLDRQAEMDLSRSLSRVQQESGKGKNDAKRCIRRKTGDTFLVLFTDIRRTRSAFSSLRQQFRLWDGRHDSNGYQRPKYYSDKRWVWQIRQWERDTDSQQFQQSDQDVNGDGEWQVGTHSHQCPGHDALLPYLRYATDDSV